MKVVSFTVQKSTVIDDGFGGVKPTWADTVTTRGRLRVLPTSSRIFGDKLTIFRTHQLEAPAVNVSESDQVKIGGSVYRIKAIETDRTYRGGIRLDLEAVE